MIGAAVYRLLMRFQISIIFWQIVLKNIRKIIEIYIIYFLPVYIKRLLIDLKITGADFTFLYFCSYILPLHLILCN